jgi:hypothetical protein
MNAQKKVFSLKQVTGLLTVVFLGIAAISHGVTLPFPSFTAGSVISAKQMNDNLNALKAAVDALEKTRAAILSLNPYGANLEGGASIGSGFTGAIVLPNTGVPSFALGFTVPEDFVGQNLTIRLIWNTASSGCTFSLNPSFISRARPNHPDITGAASGGLSGETILKASSNAGEGALAEYTVSPSQGFADIQPGDAMLFGLFRRTDSINDTCTGSLTVKGISVRYTALK